MKEKFLFLLFNLTFLFLAIRAVPYNERRGDDSSNKFRDQIMMPSDETCKNFELITYQTKTFQKDIK